MVKVPAANARQVSQKLSQTQEAQNAKKSAGAQPRPEQASSVSIQASGSRPERTKESEPLRDPQQVDSFARNLASDIGSNAAVAIDAQAASLQPENVQRHLA